MSSGPEVNRVAREPSPCGARINSVRGQEAHAAVGSQGSPRLMCGVERTRGGVGPESRPGYSDAHAGTGGHRVTLTESLCAHENPVVAYRARRLLAGESESSRTLRKLRRAIGSSEMAKRL